jgi:light-regulated signal transduction histidine kinase (bacteriophytochrome)
MDLLDKKYGHELNPQAREYMAYAVDGAHRMRELVNDLLLYSRVSSTTRRYSQVNLDDVTMRVLENLHSSIADSMAEITVNPLPTVWGDKLQLTQVLQNLISNAIKFRDTEPPRVTLSAVHGDNEWIISVEDHGIGIRADDVEKLFQMFMRFNSQEEYPGTGMGLAITKKIVEQHGGRIWAESEPCKGSVFFFTLPIRTTESEERRDMDRLHDH